MFDTFDLAIATNPDAKPLFHSDRGFQYTNRQYASLVLWCDVNDELSDITYVNEAYAYPLLVLIFFGVIKLKVGISGVRCRYISRPLVDEWIQIFNRNFEPESKIVALPVKVPYHITRNLVYIIELLYSL